MLETIKNNFLLVAKKNPLCIVCSVIYYFIAMRLYGGGIKVAIIVLLVYALSVVIALSPFGEEILKIVEKVRRIETSKEKELLIPLFEEVYEQAKQKHPNLGRIELCVIDKMSVNACALGKHTIAVTKGAIDTFSEQELKAMIAHEIAHIVNCDTLAYLYVMIGNGFFTLMLLALKMISGIANKIQYIAESSRFSKFCISVLMFFTQGFILVITFLMQLTIAINSRENEFRADKFTSELEYGEDMISALYLLEKMQLGNNSSVVQRMQASHPRITSRIEKLEELN